MPEQPTTETEALRAALRKVRGHTSYLPGASYELLAGLLASVERIVDAAISASPAPTVRPTLGAPGGWIGASPDPTTAKETPPMKQCLWCERDLTPPPTDRPYLTSAGKSICYRCVEQLAALRNPELLPPAPASAQGAAQAAEEKVYHAYEAARRLLSKHLADRVDFDVVIAGLSAARRFIFDSYTSPSTQGPPEGTRTAEPVVPASKLRALSEQWEQESDRVTLRHSSPRSAMRRCAEDLNRLLAGG